MEWTRKTLALYIYINIAVEKIVSIFTGELSRNYLRFERQCLSMEEEEEEEEEDDDDPHIQPPYPIKLCINFKSRCDSRFVILHQTVWFLRVFAPVLFSLYTRKTFYLVI